MGYKSSKKNVLITGITSGIGSEIALVFAKEGWNILGHYFSSRKKARELIQLIKKHNVYCRLFRADLSSNVEMTSFINKIKKMDLDSLINNAGTYIVNKHFCDLTTEDITKTFMVNAFAPMLLAASLFGGMKKRKFGRIVNISSIAAKYGGSHHSMHYGCSKLALEGLTKTIAREGAGYNVLANTIRPGVINTEFHKRFPKDMKKRIAKIPLKKMGTPKDIADMAYYLGSEKNSFITNEIITVSGGE